MGFCTRFFGALTLLVSLLYWKLNDMSVEILDKNIYKKQDWSDPDANVDLSGRVAIVTGSSSGIGQGLATELYKRGCTVIVTSRKLKRSEQAVEMIKKEVQNSNTKGKKIGKIEPVAFDLSDLNEVNRFAEYFLRSYDRLDFLSTNAGMAALGLGHTGPWQSKQNYEILYASNYLGHFLLIQKFLPMLKKSKGRIVATSSIMHWIHDFNLESLLPSNNKGRSDEGEMLSLDLDKKFAQLTQYGNTKLLQVIMCFELQRRHRDVGCTPVAPGFVDSKLLSQGERREASSEGANAEKGTILSKSWPFPAVDSYAGAQSSLEALLSKEGAAPKDGGVVNVFGQPYYAMPLALASVPKWMTKGIGKWRKRLLYQLLSATLPFWEVFGQYITWGNYKWLAHPDAYDKGFAKKLYEESLEAVKSTETYMKPEEQESAFKEEL